MKRNSEGTPAPIHSGMGVWYAVAFCVLALLLWLLWALVWPVMEVRAVALGPIGGMPVLSRESRSHHRDVVMGLGGPRSAARKIRLYFRTPEYLAPRKEVAVLLLGQCGEHGVPLLSSIFEDPDSGLAMMINATYALGETGIPDPWVISRLVYHVAHGNQNPVYFVANGNKDPAWPYVEALGKVDPDASGSAVHVRGYLRSPNSKVRATMIWALGRTWPGADWTHEFTDALSDVEPSVRMGALDSLGRIGPRAQVLVPVIARELADPMTAGFAARCLIRLGANARAAVPQLGEALRHKHPWVRRDAAWALAMIGPEARAAVPSLLAAMRDNPLDGEVRFMCVQALTRIGKEAIPDIVAYLEDCEEGPVHPLKEVLVQAGPGCLPQMMQLKNRDIGLSTVAKAIGEMGPSAKGAVAWLTDRLGDADDSWVEMAATSSFVAAALGRIGPDAAPSVAALVAALDNEGARKEAAIALGLIGKPSEAALPVLEKLSRSEDPGTRLCAAWASMMIRGEDQQAISMLVGALNEPGNKSSAMNLLGRMGPAAAPGALPALRKHLPESAISIWMIDGNATAAVAALQPLLSRADVGRRIWAARQLAELGTSARDALTALAADRELLTSIRKDFEGWEMYVYWQIRGIDMPPGERE